MCCGQRLGLERLAEHHLVDRLVDDLLEARHVRALLLAGRGRRSTRARRRRAARCRSSRIRITFSTSGHAHARQAHVGGRAAGLDVVVGAVARSAMATDTIPAPRTSAVSHDRRYYGRGSKPGASKRLQSRLSPSRHAADATNRQLRRGRGRTGRRRIRQASRGERVEREGRRSSPLAERPEAPFLEVEELRALVAEGRERGYLTFEEIAALPRGGRGHQGAGPRSARAPGRERRGRRRGRRRKPTRCAADGQPASSRRRQPPRRRSRRSTSRSSRASTRCGSTCARSAASTC